jgi:hypothetical protein
MTAASQETGSADPGLRDIPLDRLTAPAGSVLAHCLAAYRQRLEDGTATTGVFDSRI